MHFLRKIPSDCMVNLKMMRWCIGVEEMTPKYCLGRIDHFILRQHSTSTRVAWESLSSNLTLSKRSVLPLGCRNWVSRCSGTSLWLGQVLHPGRQETGSQRPMLVLVVDLSSCTCLLPSVVIRGCSLLWALPVSCFLLFISLSYVIKECLWLMRLSLFVLA